MFDPYDNFNVRVSDILAVIAYLNRQSRNSLCAPKIRLWLMRGAIAPMTSTSAIQKMRARLIFSWNHFISPSAGFMPFVAFSFIVAIFDSSSCVKPEFQDNANVAEVSPGDVRSIPDSRTVSPFSDAEFFLPSGITIR